MPALRRRLPVVENNLAFVRDGRLVVGCQRQAGASGRTEPAEVSVRYTEAVETVIRAAESPIRVGDLADKLTADFPETPESAIEGMLAELVAQRILVSSLRPPMTAPDPLGHVVEEPAAVGADAAPQVAELFHDLRDIHRDLSRHNRASSPTERRDLRTGASGRMTAVCTAERPVTVDLRADCALVLPYAVAREAETAAAALARLTPCPFGTPTWQDYHGKFVERGGAAGIALLHIERARTGHGDWTTAHAWLSAAARDDLSAGPNAGLYFGAPTLAFVTHTAADQPNRYQRALADLDASTVAITQRRLDTARARIDRGERPALAEFDLIRGLAGLGAYHLQRTPHHGITGAVLSYLVRLTEPPPGRTDGLPGWWTDLAPTGHPSPDFPAGHGNTGMSHGIAGPLALLSLALRRGVVVDGHTDAIDRICTWLDTCRRRHPGGPWWPGILTADEVHAEHVRQPHVQRPSWCYGTPGLARAQQLAGLATGDTARRRTAESAMLGCLNDPAQLDRIVDSGLCHGVAGVFQTAWRMAADARTPDIAAALPKLSARLLTQLRSAPEDTEFLDGHAGAALALHTAGTDTAPLTRWDACLLLT